MDMTSMPRRPAFYAARRNSDGSREPQWFSIYGIKLSLEAIVEDCILFRKESQDKKDRKQINYWRRRWRCHGVCASALGQSK